jgi:hypothetical protein
VSPSPTATPTFGNCSHDVTHLSQGNPTWKLSRCQLN